MRRWYSKAFFILIPAAFLILGFQNCGNIRLAHPQTTPEVEAPPPKVEVRNAPKQYLYGDLNHNDVIDEAFEVGLQNDPVAEGKKFVCAVGSFPWTTEPTNNTAIKTEDGRDGYFCYALACAPDRKYTNATYKQCCSSEFQVDVDGQCCLKPKSQTDGYCQGLPTFDPTTENTEHPYYFPWPQPLTQPAKVDPATRLPVLRYGQPLRFAGRVVDSVGHTDSRWDMRTMRASQILPSVDSNQIIFGLHGTVARYNLSNFFSETLLKPLQGSQWNRKFNMDPAISEKYLPWDHYFSADEGASINPTTGITKSRHGWLLGWFEGTATIDMKLDVDDRGYTYVSHEMASGWGITRGLPIDIDRINSLKSFSQYLNSEGRVQPILDMKVFRHEGRYYLVGVIGSIISMYDVTNASAPVLLWKRDLVGRAYVNPPKVIYTAEGVRFAFVNPIAKQIEFHDFETLKSGSPLYKVDFEMSSSTVKIETDGFRFFVVEGFYSQLPVPLPVSPSILKIVHWTGSRFEVATRTELPAFAPQFLHYNDGVLAAVGARNGFVQSKPVPYLIHMATEDGKPRMIQVPDYLNVVYYLEIDPKRGKYYTANYSDVSYVLPRDLMVMIREGRQYIIVFNYGVGEIFEVEKFSYVPGQD